MVSVGLWCLLDRSLEIVAVSQCLCCHAADTFLALLAWCVLLSKPAASFFFRSLQIVVSAMSQLYLIYTCTSAEANALWSSCWLNAPRRNLLLKLSRDTLSCLSKCSYIRTFLETPVRQVPGCNSLGELPWKTSRFKQKGATVSRLFNRTSCKVCKCKTSKICV